MSKVSLAIGLAIGLSACGGRSASLPYYRSATMTPEWLGRREASAPSMHRVAPFRLVAHTGEPVTETSLTGKITIVHFFFTRCGDVCPTTVGNLRRLLRQAGPDTRLQVLSYSITAESDSVAALRAFAAARGITDPRWRLVTGSRDVIERLARESYFVTVGDGATYGVASIAHTESILLVDGQRRLRGVYAGTLALEMDRLREDVATLLAERPKG